MESVAHYCVRTAPGQAARVTSVVCAPHLRFGTSTAAEQTSVLALALQLVVELPAGRIEGVADRDVDVGMRWIAGFASDHELFAWDVDIDANVEAAAMRVMSRRRFDDDATTGDPTRVTLELLLGFFFDPSFDGFGFLHVLE
jgi:hypothetical protein